VDTRTPFATARTDTRSTRTRQPTAIRSQSDSSRFITTDTRRIDRDRDGDRDRDRDGDRRWDRDRDGDRRWDGDRERSWSRYRYYRAPSYVYRNWSDRNRIYSWNNHRYRWFGNSWVIVDPGYAYVESVPAIGTGLVAEVQLELAREGYNPGPADGIAGSQTRRAIAQYQADHGLPVTARIDTPLLRSLNLG
jgi:hypothetical protein